MNLFHRIDHLLGRGAQQLVRLYQRTLSPDKGLPSLRLKGRICMHEPHCSQYAIHTLRRYGFIRSIGKIMDRISQCTGGTEKIYDPAHYRVVFFSSAPIGVPFLEKLQEDDRFEITGVVTTPDKPAGRGMKIQENIIKQTAKKVKKNQSTGKKIVLMHGKDTDPTKKRYPHFINDMKKYDIPVYAPRLPQADDPILTEWIDELEKCHPDKNTVVVGHSRGGVAILRWLEQLPADKKVKKVILIAANAGEKKFMRDVENSNGFYTHEGYNFAKIKQHCDDFVIFHSEDDQRVPFSAGIDNAQGLHANFHRFTDKNHFGSNLSQTGFPELTNEIIYDNLIQTPNSLRLDSKKYADEAQEFYTWLQHKQPDFIVVIAYGKIIPSHILDLPNIGPINVHGSLLPKYRGASPIQSVFLHHENKTGITIMEMAPTLDTGDMIDKLSFPIQRDRTAKDVMTEMQTDGPKFLVDTLRKYGKGMLGKVTQNDTKATHCSKITKEDGEINPYEDPITDIYAKYRAFALRPKIYFFHDNKRIIIEKLIIDQEEYEHYKDQPLIEKHMINNAVTDILLKPEGKKSMTRESFVKRNHT